MKYKKNPHTPFAVKCLADCAMKKTGKSIEWSRERENERRTKKCRASDRKLSFK